MRLKPEKNGESCKPSVDLVPLGVDVDFLSSVEVLELLEGAGVDVLLLGKRGNMAVKR